jgi:RNA polymerase sigma-70 factor (TIGR02960 family)
MVSMDDVVSPPQGKLSDLGRQETTALFEQLLTSHRQELYEHCYRMLGSVQDAEDALQESLLAVWRGVAEFEGRSSLRTWLYRVTTHACLRLIARRPRRMLSVDHAPPRQATDDLGEPLTGPIWLEPWPDREANEVGGPDPAAAYLRRESVELAFMATLQCLPGKQRAVLILREVLDFSAAEVARILDTTPAAVNSALQRARKAVAQRMPATTQKAELAALGPDGQKALAEAFVTAWERSDIAAILELLADDAKFSMAPLPGWFLGREEVGRFFTERIFATPWRLVPIRANGQLAFACYQGEPGGKRFPLGAINVVSLRCGRIVEITGFVDPDVHRHFSLPDEFQVAVDSIPTDDPK